jgi:hypothetical protein
MHTFFGTVILTKDDFYTESKNIHNYYGKQQQTETYTQSQTINYWPKHKTCSIVLAHIK